MATTTWINTSGGDWGTASNWSNGVPGPSDTAVIDGTGTGPITASGAQSVGTLVLNTGSVTLTGSGNLLSVGGTLEGGGDVTVANGATLSVGGIATAATIDVTGFASALVLNGTESSSVLGGVTANGGTLQIDGVFDNTGNTLTVGGAGEFSALSVGDGVTQSIYTSSGYEIAPAALIDGGTIVSTTGLTADEAVLDGVVWQGPMTLTGTSALYFAGGLSVESLAGGPGTIDLSGAGAYLLGDATVQGVTLVGSGGIIGSGALTIAADMVVDPAGEVSLLGTALVNDAGISVSAGNVVSLSAYGTVTNTASIGVSGGGLLIDGTGFVNTGTIAISNDGWLQFGDYAPYGIGTLDNPGGIALDATSTLIAGGSVTVAELSSMQLSGGTIDLTGVFDASGTSLVLDGTGPWANLQASTIVGGTLDVTNWTEASGVAALIDTTWIGTVAVADYSTFSLYGTASVQSQSGAAATISVTEQNASFYNDVATLANDVVLLGNAAGTDSFETPQSGLVFGPAPPLPVLANTTTLLADTPGAGAIYIAGNFANQGLIDIEQGSVAFGSFVPPEGGIGWILVYPPTTSTIDNQGTILADAAGTFTVGALTTLSNEGLIQIGNGDDMVMQTSVTNTGTIAIVNGGTLEFTGSVGALGTVAFAGGLLQFDTNVATTATIANFAANDTIIATGVTGGVWNGLTLTLSDGEMLTFVGDLDGLVPTVSPTGVITAASSSSQVVNTSGGGSYVYTYQPDAVVPWIIQQYAGSNGTGSVVSEIVNNANGGSYLYAYNPASGVAQTFQSWSGTAGTSTLSADVVNFASGQTYVYAYNPTSTVTQTAELWSATNPDGSAAGVPIADVVNNDDGTTLVYAYNPSPGVTQTTTDWSATNADGSAAGTKISAVVDNTDGSAIVYAYDPATGVTQTATFYSSYDAASGAPTGTPTEVIFDYTTGLYAYDSAVTTYNTSGVTTGTAYYSGPEGTGSVVSQPTSVLPPGDMATSGTITVSGAGQVVDPGFGGGTIQFLSGASDDTLVLHTGGTDTISGFDPSAGDQLDLRSLFAEAGVDAVSAAANLSAYINVSTAGSDAVVLFDPTGQGGGSAVATLTDGASLVPLLKSGTAFVV